MAPDGRQRYFGDEADTGASVRLVGDGEAATTAAVATAVAEYARQQGRWASRWRLTICMLLAAALGAMVASTAMPRLQGLYDLQGLRGHIEQLWSLRMRRKGTHAAMTMAECVVDSTLAAEYLANMGLEIEEAHSLCAPRDKHDQSKKGETLRVLNASKALLKAGLTGSMKHSTDAALRRASVTLGQVPLWMGRLRALRNETALHRQKIRRDAADGFFEGGNPEEALGRRLGLVPSAWEKGGERMFNRRPAAGMRPSDTQSSLLGTWRARVKGTGAEVPKKATKVLHEALEALRKSRQERKASDAVADLCSSAAIGSISSFFYALAYTMAVTTECPGTHNRSQYCFADWFRILGAALELVDSALAISVQCTGRAYYIAPDDIQGGRRLSEGSQGSDVHLGDHSAELADEGESGAQAFREMFEQLDEKKEKAAEARQEKQVSQASCAVDSVTAGSFFVRAGTEINAMAEHCSQGGSDNYCGASVAGFFGSLAMISNMLSDATVECPDKMNLQAACSTAITQILAAVFELTAGLWASAESCFTGDFQLIEEELDNGGPPG